MTTNTGSAAYRKAFEEGAAFAAEELRKDITAVIAGTIVAIRKECADICRKNGEHISAAEIDQLGEAKQ